MIYNVKDANDLQFQLKRGKIKNRSHSFIPYSCADTDGYEKSTETKDLFCGVQASLPRT